MNGRKRTGTILKSLKRCWHGSRRRGLSIRMEVTGRNAMADVTKNLEESWNRRKEESRRKAQAAIKVLEEEGKVVNFNSVHVQSGISKSFLYDDEEIRNLIGKHRMQKIEREFVWQKKYDKTSESKDVIIGAKDKRIKKLEEENAKLKQEIKVLRGLIYSKE